MSYVLKKRFIYIHTQIRKRFGKIVIFHSIKKSRVADKIITVDMVAIWFYFGYICNQNLFIWDRQLLQSVWTQM